MTIIMVMMMTATTTTTGCPRKNTLTKFLDQRPRSPPARRHCGQNSAAASRNGAQRRRSPQPARLLCLRAGEERDLWSKDFIRVFFLGHPVDTMTNAKRYKQKD